MPRSIQRKCLDCSALSVEEAIALHGNQGDNCWNPGNINGWGYDCHRRRSHYRHRSDINASRRRLRRSGESSGLAQPQRSFIEVTPPAPSASVAAVLVLYRQHSEAPVHAVAAEVWQGNQKLAQIQAVHCMGMWADKLTGYLKELLLSIHQQFGVARFEDVVKEQPVHACPISPCPLKG